MVQKFQGLSNNASGKSLNRMYRHCDSKKYMIRYVLFYQKRRAVYLNAQKTALRKHAFDDDPNLPWTESIAHQAEKAIFASSHVRVSSIAALVLRQKLYKVQESSAKSVRWKYFYAAPILLCLKTPLMHITYHFPCMEWMNWTIYVL